MEAPREAARWTVARPMPFVPPVMRRTLPVRDMVGGGVR